MDETKSTCFCLKEIADSKKTIAYLREQLPKVRALYDKYKGTGLKRELDALADMQRLVKQLWEEFPALIQQLNEYGDPELAGTTQNLYGCLLYTSLFSDDLKQYLETVLSSESLDKIRIKREFMG